MKIRKGDLVQVLSGKDRGKQGRVIEADPVKQRVIVENLNLVKRHRKPRLKDRFDAEIRDRLKEQFAYSSVMKVPRVQKITVNMGVGDAKVNARALDKAVEELTIIAGQRAQITRAKKSIAGFKIREGMPIGAKVPLRGARMWEFLDRLVAMALARRR